MQGCRPWGHPQILADQLTLFQPGGTDYAHLTTTGTPGFSDLPTAMLCQASGKRTTQFLEGFILVCVGDLREH